MTNHVPEIVADVVGVGAVGTTLYFFGEFLKAAADHNIAPGAGNIVIGVTAFAAIK